MTASRRTHAADAADLTPGFRTALLRWFDRNKRDLPWRRTRDPYAIWISEVMLQQTQVATVIPYWHRFLERFPTVDLLASAALPDILAMWRGLGYYSRARNLHRAAQAIAAAGMPSSAAALRELPGFGRYTAAAVASIAFGDRAAVLDGNVARVLSRVLAVEAPLGSRESEKRLWAEAEAMLDPTRPGAFNEAMMELGATLCVPADPRCLLCPVATCCAARARGLERKLPLPRARPERKRLELACAAIVRDGRIVLGRREEKGLFGGLWELPWATVDTEGGGASALRTLGFVAVDDEPLGSVQRTLTHRDLTLHLFRCRPPRSLPAGYVEMREVALDKVASLGMATAMVRAVAEVTSARLPPVGRATARGSKAGRAKARQGR